MTPRAGPLLLVVLGAVFALRVRPLYSLDVWWHLSMGRGVWGAGARAIPEPVAALGPEVYVDPEWLFDVTLLGWHGLLGSDGVILATAAAAVLGVGMAYALAREVGAGGLQAASIAAWVALAAQFRFLPRPQAWFLVLLPAVMLAALRCRRADAGRRVGGLALLHLALAVWSQSHGSVVVAPVVVWLTAFGWDDEAPPWRPAELAALAALAAWPFLGAHGVGIVDQVLRHSGGDAVRYITDMRALRPSDLIPTAMPSLVFVEILVGVGVAGAVRRRGAPWGAVGLVVLGLAMTLTAHRFRAAWAFLAVPLAAAGLRDRPAVPWLAWLPGVVLAAFAGLSAGQVGLGLHPTLIPVGLADALEARLDDGRLREGAVVYDEYGDGGYLGWRLGGRARVVIDGRTPVFFSPDDFWAWRVANRSKPVFDRLAAVFEAWGEPLEAVAVERVRRVCPGLAADSSWTAVWRDETRVLFVPSARAGGERPVDTPCAEGADDPWAPAPWDGEDADAHVAAAGHDADPAARLARARALDDPDAASSEALRAALLGEAEGLDRLRALDRPPHRRWVQGLEAVYAPRR